MLRSRLLRRRWLVYLIIAWGAVVTAAPSPGVAAPLPPMRDDHAGGDLQVVRDLLDQKIIRERLSGLGLSPAEAVTLMERLSPEERAELAARADELGAGGSALAAVGLAALVALLVIVILELMGRRVVSRP